MTKVYLAPLEPAYADCDLMRFRLTYSGPLQSKQRDAEVRQRDPLAQHTHSIRKEFHRQLKEYWSHDRFLMEWGCVPGDFEPGKRHGFQDIDCNREHSDQHLSDVVPDLHKSHGYRWLPLVREDWNLLCDLEVLFLRRDAPGGVLYAGDIDNRIKTLIDTLRIPKGAQELAGNEAPCEGEDPFYVLLEDDKMVTGFSVQTDRLLDYPDNSDQRFVKLVITVTIRPHATDSFNFNFG